MSDQEAKNINQRGDAGSGLDNNHGNNQWQLARDIAERARKAYRRKKRYRNRGQELWGIPFGEYSWPIVGFDRSKTRQSVETLMGTENIIFSHVLKLLKQKEIENDQTPVIIVDFGGMYSLSFLRIANLLEKTGDLISRGKVVVVVTNLAFTPEFGIEVLDHEDNPLPSADKLFFRSHYHLAHYIQSDAAELRYKNIRLPDGSTLSLNGNIDLLHETFALVHGLKNDVDLPMIGAVMSKRGVIFTSTKDMHMNGFDESDAEFFSRVQAHKKGEKNLLDRGFKLQAIDERSKYNIYLAPDSGEVDLNA